MKWIKTDVYCPNCGKQDVFVNHDDYEDNAGDACLCVQCWNGYYGIDVPYQPAPSNNGSWRDIHGMKASYTKETK